MTDPIAVLFELFTRGGGAAYLGEAVTQREHALQCAWLAEQAAAPDAWIAAALLHDVGHIVGPFDDRLPVTDDRHEEAAAAWLARWFGPEVTEPIRLHVAAKRYLCAVEPGYHDALSPASQHSLRLQGGVFTPAEVAAFEAGPHARAAAAVRRWDDQAKVPGLATPNMEHYRRVLQIAAGLPAVFVESENPASKPPAR